MAKKNTLVLDPKSAQHALVAESMSAEVQVVHRSENIMTLAK